MNVLKKNPFFSVIIPLYNKENEISHTLNSVLLQSFENFEILIVNDGSTDNSLDVLSKFIDNRLKIYTIENKGVSNARNYGICMSRGKYIAFLDADDLWSKYFLEYMYDLINIFIDSNIFASNYFINKIPIDFNERFRNISLKSFIINDYFNCAFYMPLITASSVVIKKACFDNNFYFNSKYTHGEDLDIWLKLFKKYQSIAYIDIALVNYNHQATNRACYKIPKLENHFAYYFDIKSSITNSEKNYYLNQVAILLWIYLRNFNFKYFIILFKRYYKYYLKITFYFLKIIISNKYKIEFKNK